MGFSSLKYVFSSWDYLLYFLGAVCNDDPF